MIPLTPHARFLLEDRYLLPGERPDELFRRVADAIDTKRSADFENVMKNLYFLPNSPTLMNAGTALGQLSACFVLPIEDSLESIFTTLQHMAMIHKSGGGTGFSFSHLRPKGDAVNETIGVASGPVSFIRVFDTATDAVKQGGKRRGANMGVLASSHPDIREFINSKREGGLCNFNLSVGFDAHFFDALRGNRSYSLINPRTGDEWDQIDAGMLWRSTASAAWATGDPGVLFFDEINRKNTLPRYNAIEATNPCGEQPLFPYESCNLGSVNLSRMIRKDEIDRELLSYVVRTGVTFLDAVIDVNRFPLPQIERQTLETRKIGLGIMGLADMFIMLGIPYESKEALTLADQLMEFIQKEAREMSQELGEWKGSFPAIDKSVFSGHMRNATVTTVAPTGSLHIIAGTSSGIEPLFSVAYSRVLSGQTMQVVSPLFKEMAGKYCGSKAIHDVVYSSGSVQELALPDEMKELFHIASEISAEHHVRMQAVIQRHVDNAVSKTVNVPESTSADDICEIFELARKLHCKGITIYRYRSKKEQVLTRGCEVCAIDG